jgi:Cdc6-like AAA superfamily ATPase
MAIIGFNRSKFEETIKMMLSPTTPIRSPELLRGREKKQEDIRRAFIQPGRQIFIFGDRGVGKTSLAQTAAYEHHPSDGEPIFLGCDGSSTFYRMAQDLYGRLARIDPAISKENFQTKAGFNWFASSEVQKSVERSKIPELKSVNEAMDAIKWATKRHPKPPVVVIDEFERIHSSEERSLFADFIKQVGDQSLDLKLIFCGVGSALDELVDSHHSCYRYLAAVQLERLVFRSRFAILDAASNALGVTVESNTRYRIAMISDGFPHYVHLLAEKLLWATYEDDRPITVTEPKHYLEAINAAVLDIEPKLKTLYEKATLKYSDDYEAILWAVADHYELKRRSSDIFDSYRRITTRTNLECLPREKFNARINALKKPAHGSILKATRQGWYEFNEAVVRGYVRLRAEERGVELGIEHPLERKARPAPISNGRPA